MSRNWLRRGVLLAACAASLLLAACGSGTTESQLSPTRVVVFGDGFADLGQNGPRYTVNDGLVNVWTEHVALGFGKSLVTASKGGTSYATGHARVVIKPDDVGNSATPTVREQIDTFLSRDTIGANDLYIVNAGVSDLIAEGQLVATGAQTADQQLANARQGGRDLAAQARRLVNGGAKFVVVVGSYNLGRSPWAAATGLKAAFENASGRFNDELLIALADLGANVLYVDAALHYNLASSSPAAYGLTNGVDPVCTSVDPGPGIGTGLGQLSSALCTPSTVRPSAVYNSYLFADRVYPTPAAHGKFGEYAFARIRARF